MKFIRLLFFLFFFVNAFQAEGSLRIKEKNIQNENYIITIPESWTVILDSPSRMTKDGYKITEQYYQTPDSVQDNVVFVTVSRLEKGDKISVHDIFVREKANAEKAFDSKVQKQTSIPSCQLYFTSSYELKNSFTQKKERIKKYYWLYQKQNVVYMLTAIYDREIVTSVENIEQKIHDIQFSFQLK